MIQNEQLWVTAEDNPVKRKVIPKEKTHNLIQEIHEHLPLAHPGTSETIRLLRQDYYWPNMDKQVACYVAKCVRCQQLKPGKTKQPNLLKFPRAHMPFNQVSMDLVGPLYDSEGEKRYVLTLICRLTRFAEAIVIPSESL